MAPVMHVQLMYDPDGPPYGIAFATYAHVGNARLAIREFDGVNAKG